MFWSLETKQLIAQWCNSKYNIVVILLHEFDLDSQNNCSLLIAFVGLCLALYGHSWHVWRWSTHSRALVTFNLQPDALALIEK